MDWFTHVKKSLAWSEATEQDASVDDLVKTLSMYGRLEEQLVELVLEVQRSNKALRKVIVKKKSISVTG